MGYERWNRAVEINYIQDEKLHVNEEEIESAFTQIKHIDVITSAKMSAKKWEKNSSALQKMRKVSIKAKNANMFLAAMDAKDLENAKDIM